MLVDPSSWAAAILAENPGSERGPFSPARKVLAGLGPPAARLAMQKPAMTAPAAEDIPPAAAAAVKGKAPPADEAAANGTATGPPSATHLTKRPEMQRVESVGLVSNDSLNEDEVEHFFAPEAALEEEERLRKEREERQAVADPPADVSGSTGCQTRRPAANAVPWCMRRAAGAILGQHRCQPALQR